MLWTWGQLLVAVRDLEEALRLCLDEHMDDMFRIATVNLEGGDSEGAR